EEAVVDLTLEVGAAAEQVTVTEEAPLVNATTSSTSGVITEQQVKELPLNGRSFDQLIALNAGVSNATSNTLNGNTWNMFSVAGKRPETNRFIINGIDWVGPSSTGQFITPYGVSGQLLGVEAVREFNVLTDSYGAEYGKRAGGQISVVTTSGTNQLHGSVFEYLRNSALDARNFFDQTNGAPPFKRNQFGGSLGGPIIKNKAFLFGNYEGFQQRWVNSAATAVPDGFARQGMLPCYMATPTACGSNPGQYVTVPNLKAGMLPYLNYFWPSPDQEIYDTQGRPTGTAYSFINPRSRIKENFGMSRFDYTLSSKDSFWANYNYDDGFAWRPPADPNFLTVDRNRSLGLGLQETHIFSPTLLNTFTYGFAKAFALSQPRPAVP